MVARFNESQRELAYRVYMTDSMKVMISADMRYWDIINPVEEDGRTGDEIAEDIITRHGLKIVG